MESIDYDGAWKEALEQYLRPFLELCFPIVANGIDWSVPIEFLDKELQEVVRDAELGKQRADKLVKVHRHEGGDEWILVHVEVQGQRDPNLPRRMFQYHHRIADRYGRRVASLAVLADPEPAWRPGPFQEELWGCRLQFEYPVCKLLDLGHDSELLEKSDNPAAVIVSAHLAAQSTDGDMGLRQQLKWALVRRLYEKGYAKQHILDLFRLIDWLLVLPDELAVAFRSNLRDYEEQKAMPYITSIERLGRQEGRQEGRLQTFREATLEFLEARFGAVPYPLREHILALQDEAVLKGLPRLAAQAQSILDFQTKLENLCVL